MRRWWCLAVLAGCDAPSPGAPDAVPLDGAPATLRRGPDRAVVDEDDSIYSPPHVCRYSYDEADRLVQLEVDFESTELDRTTVYHWDVDELVSIESVLDDPNGYTHVWANEGDGSTLAWTQYVDGVPMTPTVTHTFAGRVGLPRVLACRPLASWSVFVETVPLAETGLPDRLLTASINGTSLTYTYTGVAAGQPGTRIRWEPPEPTYPTEPQEVHFTYDARGRVVAQFANIPGDADIFRTSHLYRDDDRIAEGTYEHDDLTWQNLYTYDGAGNLLEISSLLLDEDREPTIETYEYDD